MKQEKRAGTKEFILSLLLIFVIIVASDIIRAFVSSYAIIVDILSLIIICVSGYEILIHYCAVFTYSGNEKRMRINRMIGKRNKEIESSTSTIKSLTDKKPDIKEISDFNTSIFKNKKSKYLVYKENKKIKAVLIEVDKEMENYLKDFIKWWKDRKYAENYRNKI